MARRITIVFWLVLMMGSGMIVAAAPAPAHVHGITPLSTLANVCLVTTLSSTGANNAQGAPISGLIPRDVGKAPLAPGDGGRTAPVGCATN